MATRLTRSRETLPNCGAAWLVFVDGDPAGVVAKRLVGFGWCYDANLPNAWKRTRRAAVRLIELAHRSRANPAPGTCPHGNHPDACIDAQCLDDAAERVFGVRPDEPTEISGEPGLRKQKAPGARVRRYQPGFIQLGIHESVGLLSTASFTDAAAREIALAILKRIARDPCDAALYAAGWTGSHECQNGDGCIHFDCSVCGVGKVDETGPDGPMPTHVCKGANP